MNRMPVKAFLSLWSVKRKRSDILFLIFSSVLQKVAIYFKRGHIDLNLIKKITKLTKPHLNIMLVANNTRNPNR